MSSSGAPRFKLTLKKKPSQQAVEQASNGFQSVGSAQQPTRAPLPQAAPQNTSAAAGARPGASGAVPRKGGLTLKGAARTSVPTPSSGTPGGLKLSLKGAGSSAHAAPAAAGTPQRAPVPATPASAPASGPRKLALKGQSSRPQTPAACTPATPAPAAAAATPASAPRTAPPAISNAAAGFATPRNASAASARTLARAASTTPAGAGAAGASSGIKLKGSGSTSSLGIKLKGSSSTPASGGPARLSSATPGSIPRPAAHTPGSTPATGSGPMKPRITLNKSRGRQSSMGLSQQFSLQSQHSLQQQPSTGGPLLQPVAYRQEQQQAYRQEQQEQQQVQEQQQQQAGQFDYYSSALPHSYDSNAAGAYGGMHDASYMSHGYSHGATADPAAAAAGGGMYGSGYPAAGGAIPAHDSTDPAAAAAGGGMYGAHAGDMYGMGYDAAAASAAAHVDYGSGAYWQQPQAKGQKRRRAATRPAAAAPVETSPLGPRSKRPKPGQFRDTEEEDADEDFNPKAERTRFVTRTTGGGGFATTRTKSKGPSGARAAGGWPQPPVRAPVATRPGSNRAAAAQKAAQRATQNAHAQRMHPHMMPARAGGGHMSAVVPTHRPKMMPVGSGGLGGPRSPVLGDDALMTGAQLAAAFARSEAAQDPAVVLGMEDMEGSVHDIPAAHAPAPSPAPKTGGGRGRQTPAHQRKTVEQWLQELHQQVEYVEETHPPNRETLLKLLAAVDKRDKYRMFKVPVTDEQAPNYSEIIKNPMDLSTIKNKIEGGMYSSWNEIAADIILMCANAKSYNHPTTKVHKEADIIFKYSMKYVTSFKKGKTALRGAVASAVKNAGAADAAGAAGASGGAGASGKADAGKDAADAAPSGPMTRNARRGGRRPREEDAAPVSNKRSRAPKFIALAQNTMGDFNLVSNLDGESARETYKGRPRLFAAGWGGLADGASAEGVPLGGIGKPIVRCVAAHVQQLPPDTYLKSLSRFVSGAGAAVERLVLQLLGPDLGAKLVPIPGVTPTLQQQQQQLGGHVGVHMAQHPQQQQPQQHLMQQQQQHMGVPGPAGQMAMHGARLGHVQPMQPVAQQQQQPEQQQSLAGLFGAGGVAGITPAQLAQLQQQQHQQQQQQLRQQQQQQQQQQQFVPGPHQLQAMNMARAPGAMAGRQP